MKKFLKTSINDTLQSFTLNRMNVFHCGLEIYHLLNSILSMPNLKIGSSNEVAGMSNQIGPF